MPGGPQSLFLLLGRGGLSSGKLWTALQLLKPVCPGIVAPRFKPSIFAEPSIVSKSQPPDPVCNSLCICKPQCPIQTTSALPTRQKRCSSFFRDTTPMDPHCRDHKPPQGCAELASMAADPGTRSSKLSAKPLRLTRRQLPAAPL